jgi:NTP pyrophosphatase (non-canonical NTP hydrolase)
MKPTIQSKVIAEIIKERERQDGKWGEQNHFPQFWTGILGEEFGELCEAINETVFDNGSNKGGYENMKKEAIHVAAVAIGFLECLERNKFIYTGRDLFSERKNRE